MLIGAREHSSVRMGHQSEPSRFPEQTIPSWQNAAGSKFDSLTKYEINTLNVLLLIPWVVAWRPGEDISAELAKAGVNCD